MTSLHISSLHNLILNISILTQIVFEAVRGEDWSSDIALDSVVLDIGKCVNGLYLNTCTFTFRIVSVHNYNKAMTYSNTMNTVNDE